MKNSAQRIRTSHVGRLPVPSGFEKTALRLARGEVGGEEVAAQVMPAVADVVKRQVEIGLDCIGDGEYWSAPDIRWFDQQMTGQRLDHWAFDRHAILRSSSDGLL